MDYKNKDSDELEFKLALSEYSEAMCMLREKSSQIQKLQARIKELEQTLSNIEFLSRAAFVTEEGSC